MALEIHHAPKEQGSQHLYTALREQLDAGKRVLWLVSGGSNIAIECSIAKRLSDKPNLSAALIDERYGKPGHADSNYQKLVNAGFSVGLEPVLQAGQSIEETATKYSERLETLLDEADVVIALLGIGSDGHINGVLPHSPVVNSKKLIEQYTGADFERVTVTLEGLKFVDIVYVFAYGDDKRPTLQRLASEDLPLDDQPSQILKQLSQVYLYNDQVEGEHT